MSQISTQNLLRDVRVLIDEARSFIALSVNQHMTLLYWNIGKRIHEDILLSERAEYGSGVIQNLARDLSVLYGKGFSSRNVSSMVDFYKSFPDVKILQTLSAKLTWSHFVELLRIQDNLKRDFYAQMASIDRWSVRTLREKMAKMLFERTVMSQSPREQVKQSLELVKDDGKLEPSMILQNPYILDFLNLPTAYNESDLEQAILNGIQKFLLELGVGFCFVERQKRLSVAGADYYVDLLMYNRHLRCLVVIELKTNKFKPAHKGQMEFYLKWLNQNERRPGENAPIGIILCADKGKEEVEILDLDESGIHVAEYWTELPSKHLLTQKIQEISNLERSSLSQCSKHWDLDEEDEE